MLGLSVESLLLDAVFVKLFLESVVFADYLVVFVVEGCLLLLELGFLLRHLLG